MKAINIGKIQIDNPVMLAPMTGVSDLPFRKLVRKFGCGMVVSEMIASRAMVLQTRNTMRMAQHDDGASPKVVQLAGCEPEVMGEAAKLNEDMGADIIDINFGCPVKKVVSKGAGAGILKDIDLMVSLTKAMVEHTTLPVTVKTRLGWDEDSIKIVEVAERLQDVGCKSIAIHGRTRAQMYKGNADWKPIAEVKNNQRMHIPVFGNGDIDSPEAAMKMRDEYGLDGAMIGRASIGYPWFFKEVKHFFETGTHLAPPTMKERVHAARRHLQMAIDWKGEKLGVFETRRHYTNYFKGIPNFKPYRMKMVTSDESADVFAAFDEVLEKFGDYEFSAI